MTEQPDLEHIWDIIERVEVCMFTTRCAGSLRARPLEARPNREEGVIWFVTDLHSDKEREIASEHDVGLVFVDGAGSDPAKAAEIWKSTDNMWWRGPDDPNVCVLRVRPLIAELWDGPSIKALAVLEFVKAQLTGKKPNLGENRKVTVSM